MQNVDNNDKNENKMNGGNGMQYVDVPTCVLVWLFSNKKNIK